MKGSWWERRRATPAPVCLHLLAMCKWPCGALEQDGNVGQAAAAAALCCLRPDPCLFFPAFIYSRTPDTVGRWRGRKRSWPLCRGGPRL